MLAHTNTVWRRVQFVMFSVGIAISYGLNDPGLIPVSARFVFTASRLTLGPTSLLSNGYPGLFPGDKAAGA